MTSESAAGFHPAFIFLCLGVLAAGLVAWRVNLRRAVQVLSMFLFFVAFWLAAYSGRPAWPVDLFLFSDPLLALVHTVAGRTLVPLLLVSLAFVILAALMGRVFCSHVCPLGATIDLSDRYLARRQKAKTNRSAFSRARKIKYAILLLTVGAAVAAVDLLGFCDPLVLFTRFSATTFYPVIIAVQDLALDALRPVANWLDWTSLAYAELYLPSSEGALGMWLLLLALLLLGRMQPRFWCRHLCPLGGLLGLCGARAPYRRSVSRTCDGCDACTRKCPTGAIHRGGKTIDQKECIVCLACVRVCKEDAVRFSFARPEEIQQEPGPSLGRRGFVSSLAGGLALGLGISVDAAHPSHGVRPPWVRPSRLIRPPGALPESEFLARCVRCGECLKACLTNTLQPDWHRGGLEGLWAPHMLFRHAHCEYSCNACGLVCPTGAIRDLPLKEKQHAKVGTAVIGRHTCVAWAENRRCQICDEICPYNAIYMIRQPDRAVGLPVVDPNRCVGCGTCEEKCPVGGEADIVVLPHGEFRLAAGSYVAEAKARGYNFVAKGNLPDQMFQEPGAAAADPSGRPDLPAGIEPDGEAGPALPPGIDPAGDAEPALPPGIDPIE